MSEPTSASQFGPTEEALPPSPGVVLVATFTSDPLVDSLSLLLRAAGPALPVEVAPYGQTFQQLLDPTGCFARNIHLYADPLLGWGRRSQRGVRVSEGGHGSMLQEPYVATLADILRSYLADLGSYPASVSAAGGRAT